MTETTSFERSFDEGAVVEPPADPMRTARAGVPHGVPPAAGDDLLWHVLGQKRLLLSVALVVFTASAAFYPFLPRRYEGTVKLVLRPTDQDGVRPLADNYEHPYDEAALESDVDVMSSRSLAASVARGQDLVADPEFNPLLDPGPLARAKANIGGWFRLLFGTVEGVAMPALRADPMAAVKDRFLDHLKVSHDKRSYAIDVSFWSADPAKAARLANAVASTYLDDQTQWKRRDQSRLTVDLRNRVADLRRRAAASEQKVQDYLVSSGLVDSSALASLQQQLTTLSAEAAVARSRSIEGQVRARLLADMRASGTVNSAPEVMDSPVIQSLKQQLAAADARTAVAGSTLDTLKQAVKGEETRIQQAADSEAVALGRWEGALRAEIARVSAEITRRQQAQVELDALRQTATADKTALSDALGRLARQDGVEAALRPDLQLVSPADVPVDPVFPRLSLWIVATLLFAAFSGFVAVLPRALRRQRQMRRRVPFTHLGEPC